MSNYIQVNHKKCDAPLIAGQDEDTGHVVLFCPSCHDGFVPSEIIRMHESWELIQSGVKRYPDGRVEEYVGTKHTEA